MPSRLQLTLRSRLQLSLSKGENIVD
jgi:hypothetical protein